MFGKSLVLNITCLITSNEHPQRHGFDDTFSYCQLVFLTAQLAITFRIRPSLLEANTETEQI